MNKLFVSMGLAAASVASVQLTQAADGTDGANGVDSKVWSVSATLRGFYDDNYDTSPVKHGSWGFEVSPEASVSVPLRQTDIGLRYVYGLYYYQQRDQVVIIRSTKAMMLICGLITRFPKLGMARWKTA